MTQFSDVANTLKITNEDQYRAYVQGAAEAMIQALKNRGITLESLRQRKEQERQDSLAAENRALTEQHNAIIKEISERPASDQHARLFAKYERLRKIADTASDNLPDPKVDVHAWQLADRAAVEAFSAAMCALDMVCETPAETIEGLNYQLRAMRINWEGEFQEERIIAAISRTVELIQAAPKQSSRARRTKRS